MSLDLRNRISRGSPSGLSLASLAGYRYSQTLTALCTATIDDIATTRSFHTGAEAVAALSFDLAWLIRTFHENLREAR